jgi:hypothetical protein
VGVLFILMGCGGIAAGIFGRAYYVGDADASSSFKRRSSIGSGRAIFFVAGGLLIAFGDKTLLYPQCGDGCIHASCETEADKQGTENLPGVDSN